MDVNATRVVKREVPCKLTDAEIADVARKLAAAVGEAEKLEAEKHDTVARLNESIASMYEQAGKHAAVVRRGTEDREVECLMDFDFNACKVSVVRRDNGEVVEERAMTALEREQLMQPALKEVQVVEVPSCTVEDCGHLSDVHVVVALGTDGGAPYELRCSVCECRRPCDGSGELLTVGVDEGREVPGTGEPDRTIQTDDEALRSIRPADHLDHAVNPPRSKKPRVVGGIPRPRRRAPAEAS